jgi:glutaredoxin-like YruB-family protein
MFRPIITAILFAMVLVSATSGADENRPSPTDGPVSSILRDAPQQQRYPMITLYSVSWCPHCKEAKEYLTSHNIPFTNRDVEMDEDARTELLEKYKYDRVPLIVLGNDEKILKGFSRENFERSLKEMEDKPSK